MKNFLNTNPFTFLMIVFIAFGFTSCEPETIIEERIVETVVEIPTPGETVYVSEFGEVSFTRHFGDTLQAGSSNLHIGTLSISGYDNTGFEVSSMWFRMEEEFERSEELIPSESFSVTSNESGFVIDHEYNGFESENDFFLTQEISTYDIYLDTSEIILSSLMRMEFEVRLYREIMTDSGIEELEIDFDFYYDHPVNDDQLPLIGLLGELPLEGYIDEDIDVQIDSPIQGHSEAKVEFEVSMDNYDMYFNLSDFIFEINGSEYTFQDPNFPQNITVSLTSTADIENGEYRVDENDEEEFELTITALTGETIYIKKINWNDGQNITDSITLNWLVEM